MESLRAIGTFSLTFDVNGAVKGNVARLSSAPILSRMMNPTDAIPSPFAEIMMLSVISMRGGMESTTRGIVVPAARTKTTTGVVDPGLRFTSTADDEIVTRPRMGAVAGIGIAAVMMT